MGLIKGNTDLIKGNTDIAKGNTDLIKGNMDIIRYHGHPVSKCETNTQVTQGTAHWVVTGMLDIHTAKASEYYNP